jgi:hypothetical protein
MLKGQLIDPVFWKSGIEKLLISLALEIVAPLEGRVRHMRRIVPQSLTSSLTGQRAGCGTATERWGRVVVFECRCLNEMGCDGAREANRRDSRESAGGGS